MAETTTPSVKKYYDYAQEQVDEQAILDKYNAATIAQFNAQREQNRQNENAFYNQMYNTQKTAMDTIRQSNAAAVASGASRGVQAAQELSSLLGLQQESVASATELAQANRQTAQEETAAVLENVLNAYQQSVQQRQQLVQQGIESASVDVQSEANEAANRQADAAIMQAEAQAKQTQTQQAQLLAEAAENGTNTYLTALSQAGINYSDGVVTPESQNSLNVALSNIGKTANGDTISFNANDWSDNGSGAGKAKEITSTINTILDTYGLDKTAYKETLDALNSLASNTNVSWVGWYGTDADTLNKLGVNAPSVTVKAKTEYADMVQQGYQNIIARIKADYASGANRKKKSN